MKKRILSVLLLVAMLITGIPVMAVSASDTAATGDQAASTNYADLYVGAANGPAAAANAKLLGLFTAFKGETDAYDLTNGLWHNKLDATGATDAILRDNTDATSWAVADLGGLTAGVKDHATFAALGKTSIGIDFYGAWLDNANFTVEASAVYYGINDPDHNGNYSTTTQLCMYNKGYETFRLDALRGEYEGYLTTVNSVRLYMFWRTLKCGVTYCHGANHVGRNTSVAEACGIPGSSNYTTAYYIPGGNTLSCACVSAV